MKISQISLIVFSSVFLLAACASTPERPTVLIVPGSGKPIEAFQQDQQECQQYAQSQVEGQANKANWKTAGSALLGFVGGSMIGGAIDHSHGAEVGAVVGTAAGAGLGAHSGQKSIQQQYDAAYAQCMTTKGDQVPGGAAQ